MEYTVIKKTDANELISEVNTWINKGWKPTGGISIAFGRIKKLQEAPKTGQKYSFMLRHW